MSWTDREVDQMIKEWREEDAIRDDTCEECGERSADHEPTTNKCLFQPTYFSDPRWAQMSPSPLPVLRKDP